MSTLVPAIDHLIERGAAFVAWRPAHASTPVLILPRALDRASGFSMSPFDDRFGTHAVHWPADHVVAASAAHPHLLSDLDLAVHDMREAPPMDVADQASFEARVARHIEAIRRGDLRKVVAARCAPAHPVPPDRIGRVFDTLCAAHPSAHVSLTVHPESGLWIGATPEVLTTRRGTTWQTIALAGTRPAGSDGPWGAKERDEQAIITQTIQDRLTARGITDLEIGETTTRAAGPVEHIATPIRFRAALDTQVLLDTLHPTPAVAGEPLGASLDAIAATEGDRLYYAGHLGWERPGGEALFVVNLRCMRLLPDSTEVFVGAGITAGSDPGAEWEETERKAETMFAALRAANGDEGQGLRWRADTRSK